MVISCRKGFKPHFWPFPHPKQQFVANEIDRILDDHLSVGMPSASGYLVAFLLGSSLRGVLDGVSI